MPHAKKATKMTESIKEKILDIHAIVSNRLNSNEKSFSSEKSIVFDFAWQFSVKYQSLIENIDFETSLFNSFSDGTFLDLFLDLKENGVTYKVGIEFKFPYKKKSNTGHTEARQKIINDIKRVTWLVKENKIDLGVFICFTNEGNYINEGNYSKAQSFITHHNKEYKKEEELPSNEQYKEKVTCINDLKFEWSNIVIKNEKYIIPDNKFAVLKPILIYKMDQQPHDNSAKYYDFVFERRFGAMYNMLTQNNLSKIKNIALNGKILDFGAGTGRISIPLATDGYEVTAIDCSSEMLEELRRKAQNRNLNIETHLKLTDINTKDFDLAIAIFTVLAYLKTQPELKGVFELVYSLLKPGGFFMFDLESRASYDQICRIKNGIVHNSAEDYVTVNFQDNNSNLCDYSEKVKGTLPSGEVFNYTESFVIKFWTIDEVRLIFNQIGFTEIENFALAHADYLILKKP